MSSNNIAVIDYGMGNLKSVSNALDCIGCQHVTISEPSNVSRFDKVIIPGVGAFSEAIDNLRRSGMFEALTAHVAEGKFLLGICLGMQLLCKESMENGHYQGFGWIDARVVRFPESNGLKVPHMGWNALDLVRSDSLLENIHTAADVYFVHSYYVDCANDDVLARTEYGIHFPSIVARGRVFGMQFHPEKSQQVGIILMKNFVMK